MLGLRVVVRDDPLWRTPTELLIPSAKQSLRVPVAERDTAVPLISLLLHEHYRLDRPIYAGERLGMQMAAFLPYLWEGRQRFLHGAVVPLLGGPLVAVPFGFFDSGPH